MSTVLKEFQQAAVNSAVRVLQTYLRHLSLVSFGSAEARQLRAQDSALLLEAPTGTGKTLIAGSVAEQLSSAKVIWFWFAPFSGVVEQAESVIRSEFPGLRVRSLVADRQVNALRSGDVFVATWALIANAANRVHQESEDAPGLETFIRALRLQGYRIGVVVDEAHHTFSASGQAFEAYRTLLAPDVTLLITATPNDRDVGRFLRLTQLEHLHRVTISRESGVKARLLKKGVRVGVLRAHQFSAVIDFRRTAVKTAVSHHKALKELLRVNGVPMTPLLLVQVESGVESIGEVEGWLRALGFTEQQVRKHTADEPNPSLLADAADDGVEVLLFKMAIATGFDAPRAFTLCSLRATADADFGVQLVGRILRVDRRLQPLEQLPEELDLGYVFLADGQAQQGLKEAAVRINGIKDSYENLSNNVVVFELTETVVAAVEDGQAILLTPKPVKVVEQEDDLDPVAAAQHVLSHVQSGLFDFTTKKADSRKYGSTVLYAVPAVAASTNKFDYPLRNDLTFPMAFQRAVVSLDQHSILADLVKHFPYEKVVDDSRRTMTELTLRLTSLFDDQMLESRRIRGHVTQKEIAQLAQASLFNVQNASLDMRLVEEALVEGLRQVYDRKGWEEAEDPDKVLEGWQKILAFNPGELERTVSSVVSRFTVTEEAAPLPAQISSSQVLKASLKNIYGRYPADLNKWEQNFAERLDDLPEILWWHRNPVRKPYSISIPITGYSPKGNHFYPDFVVGVRNRTMNSNGILLIETKGEYNNAKGDSVEKAQAIHPSYGNVMMLYWDRELVWRLVIYNEVSGMNQLSEAFDPHGLASY